MNDTLSGEDIGTGQVTWYTDNDNIMTVTTIKEQKMTKRRLVKVVVIDPDKNLSDEDALLLLTEEFVTDESDEAIFYRQGLVELLKAHNERRGEHGLKPIKIDDLCYSVIQVKSVNLVEL